MRITSSLKRLVFLTATFVCIFSGFGIFVQQAFASGPFACGANNPSGPQIVMFNRRWGCGYFNNIGYTQASNSAGYLNPNGLNGDSSGGVNTVGAFVAWVQAGLNPSAGARANTASEFYIYTMLGINPPVNVGFQQYHNLTTADPDFDTWAARLNTYSNLSENGNVSVGTNGSIHWYQPETQVCAAKPNFPQASADSYYETAVGGGDVAPWWNNENCGQTWYGMVIYDNSGNAFYYIDRLCGNVRIETNPLSSTPAPQFTLNPSVTATVNGNNEGSGGTVVAQSGDSLQFTYTVSNALGATSSYNVCTSSWNYFDPGYQSGGSPYPAPAGASAAGPEGGPTGPDNNCTQISQGGSAQVTGPLVTIPSSDDNSTICSWLGVNMSTFQGPGAGVLTCVVIANDPYLKVFGGDVSTGGYIETWNQGSTDGYAGAGTQYAAFAANDINNFASAQNGAATAAAPPTGLTFANDNTASKAYGGDFGAPAISMPDYYSGSKSATVEPSSAMTSVGDLNTLGSGNYLVNSSLTLNGGALNPGNKVVLYVNGDLFINGSNTTITYGGSPWASINDIPLLEIIVRGDIYIGSGITRLDGTYISQAYTPSGGGTAGGTIYTCATSATPISTSLLPQNTCSSKLTVNGSFVANDIEFLRTNGSLNNTTPSNETSDDNGNGNDAAEVFNFGPANWLAQPEVNVGQNDSYDSITGLPPIL
jgi:hypothetical protein